MRVDGHLVLGSNLAFMGDLDGGLEHLDRGIEYFESQRQDSRRFQIGANAGVSSYTTSALTLWQRGFPDRAVERANRAVTLATELRHPFTMAYALFHTGFLHLWRQEPELMRDRAVGVLDVADEYELPIWRALGAVLLGAARPTLGHVDEGLAEIRDGVAQYQGTQEPARVLAAAAFRSRARVRAAGRAGRGTRLHRPGARDRRRRGTLPPLFFAMKGDLLALPERGDAAEPASSTVFDVAAEPGARMPQLRAALGLCRAQQPNAAESCCARSTRRSRRASRRLI